MTIMLALYYVCRLAYATSQDRQWTLASWECQMPRQPLSFQGKLYTIESSTTSYGEDIHKVFEINPPVQDGAAGATLQVQPPKLIATIPAHKLIYPDGLAQCGSEILVLGHNDFTPREILICKLTDLVLQRFNPIKNIGGNTLFLGERNISVSSKILRTVKGDNVIHIRTGGRPYLGQYQLSGGTILPAIDNCDLYGLVPGPSSLSLHIFSCCFLDLWIRGLMFREIVHDFCARDEQDVIDEETWLPVFQHAED